jgi:hypothetical protein
MITKLALIYHISAHCKITSSGALIYRFCQTGTRITIPIREIGALLQMHSKKNVPITKNLKYKWLNSKERSSD